MADENRLGQVSFEILEQYNDTVVVYSEVDLLRLSGDELRHLAHATLEFIAANVDPSSLSAEPTFYNIVKVIGLKNKQLEALGLMAAQKEDVVSFYLDFFATTVLVTPNLSIRALAFVVDKLLKFKKLHVAVDVDTALKKIKKL